MKPAAVFRIATYLIGRVQLDFAGVLDQALARAGTITGSIPVLQFDQNGGRRVLTAAEQYDVAPR